MCQKHCCVQFSLCCIQFFHAHLFGDEKSEQRCGEHSLQVDQRRVDYLLNGGAHCSVLFSRLQIAEFIDGESVLVGKFIAQLFSDSTQCFNSIGLRKPKSVVPV